MPDRKIVSIAVPLGKLDALSKTLGGVVRKGDVVHLRPGEGGSLELLVQTARIKEVGAAAARLGLNALTVPPLPKETLKLATTILDFGEAFRRAGAGVGGLLAKPHEDPKPHSTPTAEPETTCECEDVVASGWGEGSDNGSTIDRAAIDKTAKDESRAHAVQQASEALIADPTECTAPCERVDEIRLGATTWSGHTINLTETLYAATARTPYRAVVACKKRSTKPLKDVTTGDAVMKCGQTYRKSGNSSGKAFSAFVWVTKTDAGYAQALFDAAQTACKDAREEAIESAQAAIAKALSLVPDCPPECPCDLRVSFDEPLYTVTDQEYDYSLLTVTVWATARVQWHVQATCIKK